MDIWGVRLDAISNVPIVWQTGTYPPSLVKCSIIVTVFTFFKPISFFPNHFHLLKFVATFAKPFTFSDPFSPSKNCFTHAPNRLQLLRTVFTFSKPFTPVSRRYFYFPKPCLSFQKHFHLAQTIFTFSKPFSHFQNHFHFAQTIFTFSKPFSPFQNNFHYAQTVFTSYKPFSLAPNRFHLFQTVFTFTKPFSPLPNRSEFKECSVLFCDHCRHCVHPPRR